ncbi:NADH dehydrogenase [ubiquinone] 1 alpha subcomplex assembly factor 8 [Polypterus senegalus]|uniref:NADH dehydrogenase [ubiquinone] 1 alpha subcomplex assembly factor 8 n=1 Tax=Polypterus senegalus TaxID=55291 RepID=UPI0019634D7D|nr:NADH dehydrogenase [ubiquinone] 1 alpha subcomplex assembly factor 8 [Polypterus senegalus]
MSGSNVWFTSRERMRRFPELLAVCAEEAAVYGKCVASASSGKYEVRKDMCGMEFQSLKRCFIDAAKKIK